MAEPAWLNWKMRNLCMPSEKEIIWWDCMICLYFNIQQKIHGHCVWNAKFEISMDVLGINAKAVCFGAKGKEKCNAAMHACSTRAHQLSGFTLELVSVFLLENVNSYGQRFEKPPILLKIAKCNWLAFCFCRHPCLLTFWVEMITAAFLELAFVLGK